MAETVLDVGLDNIKGIGPKTKQKLIDGGIDSVLGLAVAIPIAIIGWIFTRSKNKTVQKQKSGSHSVNIQTGRDLIIENKEKHER